MEDEQARKKIKLMIGGAVIFVVAIVVIALANILPKIGKIEVYIGYAPFVAEVTVDGKKVKNDAKMYLAEGEHILRAEYNGFETVEKEFIVTRETTDIYGGLMPQTDEARELMNKYMNDYDKIDGVFGNELMKEGEKEREKWPIMNKLPISNSLYRVGYIVDDNITLTVAASEAYMDLAVEELTNAAKEIGDNLAKYKIDFKEYNNVLAGSFVANAENSPESFVRKGFSGVGGFNIVSDGRIGDYYFAYVTTGFEEYYSVVHYRLIARQSGGEWSLVSTPSPIMTLYNTQDVPMEVIESVNAL